LTCSSFGQFPRRTPPRKSIRVSFNPRADGSGSSQIQTRLAASRVSSRLGASVRVKRKSAKCQFDVTEAPNLTETEKFARLERIRSYATPHVHAYNLARASSVFCCKRLDSPGLILMTYEVKPNDQAAPPSYERGPPLVNADYPRASRAALPRQIE